MPTALLFVQNLVKTAQNQNILGIWMPTHQYLVIVENSRMEQSVIMLHAEMGLCQQITVPFDKLRRGQQGLADDSGTDAV